MVLLLCSSLSLLGVCAPALAEPDGEVQAARLALSRYDIARGARRPLDAFARLTVLVRPGRLGPLAQAEARFLRAAAAADLLILARVRGDAALPGRIAAALGADAGTLDAHLDAELATCSAGPFRELTEQLRGALAISRQPRPWPWSQLRALSGSAGALLFLHQFATLAVTDRDPTRGLADYGVDPCAGSAACPAPYAAFDAPGRIAVFALSEAGRAVRRLFDGADAGDPLAAAAVLELATFVAALPAVELRPGLRPHRADTWLDAHGSSPASSAELWLHVSETGVRYGFAPRVRLRPDGELELWSPHAPVLPATAEVPFRATLPPFMESVPELVRFLSSPAAASARRIALVIEAGTPAHRMGRVLASARRAGHDRVLVMGETPEGLAVAQDVRIARGGEAQESVALPPQVALRVRLGGYTLYERGRGKHEDIPRVRDEQGFSFDEAALAARLSGRDIPSAQLSFMGEVAAEHVVLALLEAGKTSRSLDIMVP